MNLLSAKICIPIVQNTIEKVKTKMHEIKDKADIIEIWFGELFENETNISQAKVYIEEIQKTQKEIGNVPLLFTIKDFKEKGRFAGSHNQKKEIARMLWQYNVEFIDLDYEFDIDFFEILKKEKLHSKTQLILSAHFFEGTPSFPSLKNRIQLMLNRGADIIKIAAMPRNTEEVLDILRLCENLHRKKIRYVAISMGDMGKITRIIGPLWGAEFTFATIDSAESSAPGQMTKEEIQNIWNILQSN